MLYLRNPLILILPELYLYKYNAKKSLYLYIFNVGAAGLRPAKSLYLYIFNARSRNHYIYINIMILGALNIYKYNANQNMIIEKIDYNVFI